MSITAAGVAAGNNGNNTTSVALSADISVTAGQMIVVCGMKYTPGGSDSFAAGDCSKSSGTATIGTVSQDVQTFAEDTPGSLAYMASAIWSAIVTASGTLRMQITDATSGAYILIGVEAFNPGSGRQWGSSRVEDTASANITANNTTPSVSGDVDTAGEAVIVGAMQVNSSAAATLTPDAAFTTIYENETSTDDNGACAYRIVSTATTDQAEWAISSGGSWSGSAICAVAYKTESSGGGPSGLAPGVIRALVDQGIV
jgi:hypothetical protein